MGRLFLLAITILLAFAGCIQPLSDEKTTADHSRTSTSGGTMSASESTEGSSGPCEPARLLGGGNGKFCASRVITVKGTLTGFPALDVALETFNGDVTIKPGSEGSWLLVATITANADSEAAAKSRVDEVVFTWAHEDANGHFVDAKAKHEGQVQNLKAQLDLSMPRSLLMTIVARTSNGDATLEGGKTNGLALATSNGDVVAKGEATQTSLVTSNGDVEATLTPTSDARWTFTTSNGDVVVKVPEGATYGYSFEGTTSNGEVTYSLSDGQKGPCPQGSEYYTPPCNHRTFETNGFGSRDRRVSGIFTTSNGEISAAAS